MKVLFKRSTKSALEKYNYLTQKNSYQIKRLIYLKPSQFNIRIPKDESDKHELREEIRFR